MIVGIIRAVLSFSFVLSARRLVDGIDVGYVPRMEPFNALRRRPSVPNDFDLKAAILTGEQVKDVTADLKSKVENEPAQR